MVFNNGPLLQGYNVLTEEFGIHKEMMMDIGVYLFSEREEKVFLDDIKETAFLLLGGHIEISWDDEKREANRKSLFDEKPTCLHVPKGVLVKIRAFEESEVLIQKTTNKKSFPSVYYLPSDLKEVILGDGVYQDTARRVIRDIFNIENAQDSNMVLGEIISLPGRWSSYPPHSHRQPEVYYYRFDKPQGFGCCIIGDDAFVVKDRSFSTIPGGLCHPQNTAPGYAMYYTWMIRHFDLDPWNERIFDEDHKWLLGQNPDIWQPK